MIILGEWFLSLHSINFQEGRIYLQDHECLGNMEWSDNSLDNMDQDGIFIRGIYFRTDAEEDGLQAMDLTIDTSNISKEYWNFIHLFEKKIADKLPPHQTYDHAIDLVPRGSPKW